MNEREIQLSYHPKNGPNAPVSQLIELCRASRELAGLAGVNFAIGPDRGVSRFLCRSLPQQLAILRGLETYLQICTAALEEGALGAGKSLSLTWSALRKLGLRPRGDLFSHLIDEDLIEIYSIDGIQIFRSFNMFDCISYTLEEIASYEWWELFERDERVTQKLMQAAQEIISEPLAGTKFFDDPPHLIAERFSMMRIKAHIKTKLASPLFQFDGKVGGYISASILIRMESGIDLPFKPRRIPLRRKIQLSSL